MPDGTSAASSAPPGKTWRPVRYAKRLIRGEVPLGQVFWHDMLLIGTLVNIGATLAALAAFLANAPAALAVGLHFSPMPYNLFLVASVWQSASRSLSPWSFPAQVGAMLWLIAAVAL